LEYSDNLFFKSHRDLIVKAIEELSFEEIFEPIPFNSKYVLQVDETIYYTFHASKGIWNNFWIKAESLKKYINGTEQVNFTMNNFFREVQEICQMSDQTLAGYLEEGNQTIFAEYHKAKKLSAVTMSEVLDKSFYEIDQILLGHPKLIMNKGRIGWDIEDQQRYAPELGSAFKVHWVAIKGELLDRGTSQRTDLQHLYRETLGEYTFKELSSKIDFSTFFLVPIHPWQWANYAKVQFFEYLMDGKIIDLGEIGQDFSAQSSLRTLTGIGEILYDIKVSLSILNTSCVRGIPSKYIKSGYSISDTVSDLISSDNYLAEKVEVLKEVHAVKVKNPYFDPLEQASYRYKELLGAVWRESVASKLSSHERAIPTAALFFSDEENCVVGELISKSILSARDWIKRYFEVVVLPLYHLQNEHGIGLVSHGQNTILVLEGSIPVRLIIKDFHGDLRIADNSKHLEHNGFDSLDKLPPQHLIHDLYTGHFISVLRYLSRVMDQYSLLGEEDFYGILSDVVQSYHRNFSVNPNIDLLKENFEKILVNKIRFKVGYDETAQRLKPELGNLILNPLFQTRAGHL